MATVLRLLGVAPPVLPISGRRGRPRPRPQHRCRRTRGPGLRRPRLPAMAAILARRTHGVDQVARLQLVFSNTARPRTPHPRRRSQRENDARAAAGAGASATTAKATATATGSTAAITSAQEAVAATGITAAAIEIEAAGAGVDIVPTETRRAGAAATGTQGAEAEANEVAGAEERLDCEGRGSRDEDNQGNPSHSSVVLVRSHVRIASLLSGTFYVGTQFLGMLRASKLVC